MATPVRYSCEGKIDGMGNLKIKRGNHYIQSKCNHRNSNCQHKCPLFSEVMMIGLEKFIRICGDFGSYIKVNEDKRPLEK